MKNMDKLQITTPSDREIAMTRAFDALDALLASQLARGDK